MPLNLSAGEWITLAGVLAAVLIGIPSLIIGWLSYQRHADIEPWRLTKFSDEHWELERLHKRAVWITHFLNFHGGGVWVVNGMGLPGGTFTRGRRILLRLEPLVPGTQLTVFSRPATRKERRSDMVIAPEYHTAEGLSGDSWSANVY